MKKYLIISMVILLICSVSLIGIGCKEKAAPVEEAEEAAPEVAEEAEEAEEAAPEEVTLDVMIWTTCYTDGVKAELAALEEETGIKCEIELIPGEAEGEALIRSRIATGEMSDILNYNAGALLQTLKPVEYFVDISEQPFAANITDDFKRAASVDGKLYGVPAGFTYIGGWIYNKNIYKELELEIPTTWAEFMDNCEKIKAAGYTAILGTFADAWTAQFTWLHEFYILNALDPEFVDNYTANKAHFADTPAALRSYEKIEEIYKRGLMNEDYATVTYDEGQRMLAEGKVAHYNTNSYILGLMSETYPEAMKFLGMFPQPGDDPNIRGWISWAGLAWYGNKSSERLESVIRFMEFMTSQECVDAFASNSKIPGALSLKGIKLPANTIDIVFEVQPDFDAGKSVPALEFLSPIKGPNSPEICVEIGMGIKTALEGAQAYDEDVKTQAQQLGLEGW